MVDRQAQAVLTAFVHGTLRAKHVDCSADEWSQGAYADAGRDPGAQTWPCRDRLAKDQRVEDCQPYAGETTMAINVWGGCGGSELLLPNARRVRNCLYSSVLFTRHLKFDQHRIPKAWTLSAHAVKCVIWQVLARGSDTSQ